MDTVDMRVVITVLSFVAFIGIVLWAYSGRQKNRFDEAANLPFADEEMQQRTVEQELGANPGSHFQRESKSNKSGSEVTHG